MSFSIQFLWNKKTTSSTRMQCKNKGKLTCIAINNVIFAILCLIVSHQYLYFIQYECNI